jgi:glycine cleavage system H lipoate-binding protein
MCSTEDDVEHNLVYIHNREAWVAYRSDLTTVGVPHGVRDRLRRAARQQTARADRTVSMGEVIAAALTVAAAHPGELQAAIDSADGSAGSEVS